MIRQLFSLHSRPSLIALICPWSVIFRAVELRPDLTCLWKLLGDACTAVSTVSPNRAQVVVPVPLADLVPNTQSQLLNQAQALQVGERYDHKSVHLYIYNIVAVWLVHFCHVCSKFNTVRMVCVQMLCSGLEADVWSPQFVAWPWTQLLPPVLPALPLRSECHMSPASKGPGGETESYTSIYAMFDPRIESFYLFFSLVLQVFKKGCYVGQWKS